MVTFKISYENRAQHYHEIQAKLQSMTSSGSQQIEKNDDPIGFAALISLCFPIDAHRGINLSTFCLFQNFSPERSGYPKDNSNKHNSTCSSPCSPGGLKVFQTR